MKAREMVEVRVYDDGRITLSPASPYAATQRLYFSNHGEGGVMYICKRGTEAYYIDKMVKAREKKIQKDIQQLKEAKARIVQEAERLKKEGII